MPRPGSTPKPTYEGLPYGQNKQANDQQVPEFTPTTPEEQFLFAPTDRPDEPVTAGLPFGPGPGPLISPVDPDAAKKQLANQLLSSPNSPPETRKLAKRMLSGA